MEKKYIDYTECDQVQDFITGKIQNLLFSGKAGRGKTYTLRYMAKAMDDGRQAGLGISYLSSVEYVERMNDALYKDYDSQNWPYFMSSYMRHNILFLDDLGVEAKTENNMQLIWRFLERLNERRDDGKVVRECISTNLTLEEIRERYDERVLSRLIGNFTVLLFEGDDWRLKAAKIEKPSFTNKN